MNVCRVVQAAACAVAFALAVGAADAVTRVQPTSHRALQKDTAVDSVGDNFAQTTCERKRDPEFCAAASPALLPSSSSSWSHSSVSKSPPAGTDAAALTTLHYHPDVYQLKKDSDAASCSEKSSFVYLDTGVNYQQDGAIAHAPHWELYKVAGVSCQSGWFSSPLWKAEVDSSALLDASDASCFNGDCGQYPSDDLLLALISDRNGGESGAADSSGVLEGSSALSVDEINDVLSVLDEVASDRSPLPIISSSREIASPQESKHDAQNENPVIETIPMLEHGEGETEVLLAAEVVDGVSGVFSSSLEENSVNDGVTEPAVLGAVAATGVGVGNLTQPNWIDSLEVGNISSCLFLEIQQPKHAIPLPQLDDVMASPVATGKIDSRVYVPKFSVQIEGRPPVTAVQPKPFVQHKDWSAPSTTRSPRLPVGSQAFLVGPPPPVFAAASSQLSRKDRVERWKEKRRARSFVPRAPNPNLSESRKAVAAKRQRVGGRFIGCGGPICAPFVAITALQS